MLRLQGSGSNESPAVASLPVRTSEDWVVLDSGKSFAWSAQQQGSPQEQLETLRKLIEQQQQQVQPFLCLGSPVMHRPPSLYPVSSRFVHKLVLSSPVQQTHADCLLEGCEAVMSTDLQIITSQAAKVWASLARHSRFNCAIHCALLCALH